MTADVWPVTESFAAEIGDVDLSRPLSDADWLAIDEAYRRYSVLVFPGQKISQDQHVAFARRFGPIDMSMMADMDDKEMRVPIEIADVSNLDADGKILGADHRLRQFGHGNRLWHTDSSFKEVPANASLLHIRTVPPVGGQTEFADMRAAYDALPEATKHKIEGRVAIHSIAYSRAKMGFAMSDGENAVLPKVPQVLVRSHAHSGRKSLYVASHAGEIVGMDEEEAGTLLAELIEHATQRQFVYCHRWRASDLVIWDNRCTMHRGRPFDDLRWPRDAQRATTLDVASTCEQEGITIAAE
jgi:alpha-ketoglutarate-dependent 2,4-dichlorophenoxyacetate dioxygenase